MLGDMIVPLLRTMSSIFLMEINPFYLAYSFYFTCYTISSFIANFPRSFCCFIITLTLRIRLGILVLVCFTRQLQLSKGRAKESFQ